MNNLEILGLESFFFDLISLSKIKSDTNSNIILLLIIVNLNVIHRDFWILKNEFETKILNI